MLPVPCPIEQEARDDIPGGIPMTAIAGLFPTFTFQEDNDNTKPGSVCSKLDMFQTRSPKARRP